MSNQQNFQNILDSWIAVEHLSEGDIKLEDKKFFDFQFLKNNNFYDFFLSKLKKDKKLNSKSGIVVYFNIFKFTEIIDILQIEKTEEDIQYNNKYSFALYFNINLDFKSELTFVTSSYFIKEKKKFPIKNEFEDYEDGFKKYCC